MKGVSALNASWNRIIWAVDAFSQHPDNEVRGLDWIPELTRGQYREVEPVFVLDDIDESESVYHPDAMSSLSRIASLAGIPRISRPKLIDSVEPPYFSEMKAANALVNYAWETKASLIAIHTHSRTFIQRLIVQGFSEAAVQKTEVPLLVLGENLAPARSIRRVTCVDTDERRSEQLLRAGEFLSDINEASMLTLPSLELSEVKSGRDFTDLIVVPRPFDSTAVYEPIALAQCVQVPVWIE